MKVTLSVDALSPCPGGIGRYTWQLCKGLSNRPDIEPQFFAHNRLIANPEELLTGVAQPCDRRPFRKVRQWLERRKLTDSLIHGPNYFLPQFAEQGVITAHDLSVFRFPETHPVERVQEFERRFESSLARAVKIITDTEVVRGELIADFGLPEDRVIAIHLGVDGRFRPQQEPDSAATLAKLGLRYKEYALCVSTIEPRKKIAELLQAWRRLPAELRNRFPIVLAGGSGWLSESLRDEIARDSSEGWLKYLGYVDDADLPALYGGAALFAYPSIYEGFGLPPLEAMACGTPVVVAPRSCMPEVCGDAALFADPEDPEQMLACLAEILSDRQLQDEMSRRGLERAAHFTWERCVEATVDVYRRANSLIS